MTPTEKAVLGARRAKYVWRIREAMSKNGMTSFVALGRELGVTDETVRRTVHGTLHTSIVLDWLRTRGVPEEYLCDPRNG